MSENQDLRELLAAWPYDPDEDARFVRGDDGREVLQVRTPLGIEQFELDGRPDGLRPHGAESELSYQLRQLAKARAAGTEEEFALNSADCGELIAEGTIYYFRYLRLFQLKDWPRTIRDTERNLRLFDFIHRHAARPEDRDHLERWRPYLLRMHGAAGALQQVERSEHDDALATLRRAVRDIEALEEMDDETWEFERERSLESLRDLEEQIRRARPVSKVEQLERQLREAIERQEFERAARLRDRLRLLKARPASA